MDSYRVPLDPRERHNLAQSSPKLAKQWRAKLTRFVEAQLHPRGDGCFVSEAQRAGIALVLLILLLLIGSYVPWDFIGYVVSVLVLAFIFLTLSLILSSVLDINNDNLVIRILYCIWTGCLASSLFWFIFMLADKFT